MNLYFQFLTQDQTSNAINLINFSSLFGGEKNLSGRSKVSAHGSVQSSTFISLENFLKRRAETQFAELEVLFPTNTLKIGSTNIRIKSFNGVLHPAPTSALWLRAKDWRTMVTRSSENQYMTAKSFENALAHSRVRCAPSLFEMVLKFDSSTSNDAMLDLISDRLVTRFHTAGSNLDAFGCCDIGGSEVFARINMSSLMAYKVGILQNTRLSDYPSLGKKLEALHPLIFGSRMLCNGLASGIGKYSKVRTIAKMKNAAVLRIDSKCGLGAETKRVSRWLFPLPKGT